MLANLSVTSGLFVIYVLRQGLTMKRRPLSRSCSPSWPQTPNSSASFSLTLRFQVCGTCFVYSLLFVFVCFFEYWSVGIRRHLSRVGALILWFLGKRLWSLGLAVHILTSWAVNSQQRFIFSHISLCCQADVRFLCLKDLPTLVPCIAGTMGVCHHS